MGNDTVSMAGLVLPTILSNIHHMHLYQHAVKAQSSLGEVNSLGSATLLPV